MYHNLGWESFENHLQTSELGDHGIDEGARESFYHLLGAGCYLVFFQEGCDEVAHTLIRVFG